MTARPALAAPDATPGHDAAPWWTPFVPEWVVTAFDACARTGRGPTQEDCDGAWRDVAARTNEVLSRADVDDDTRDDAGDPEGVFDVFVRHRYGWAVPAGAALDAIADAHRGERLVEIGTGSGYVAACLRARGLDVLAVNGARRQWSGWWTHRFVDDVVHAQADALDYGGHAYLMAMPDTGQGDMMAEALFRMPVGSTLWLYAPEHCSGSPRGHALARAHFTERARLPMLDRHPYEKGGGRSIVRLEKVSQPATMPAPTPRPAHAIPF